MFGFIAGSVLGKPGFFCLAQISSNFQGLVRVAIDGDYGGWDANFFDVGGKDIANWLRAMVYLENERLYARQR